MGFRQFFTLTFSHFLCLSGPFGYDWRDVTENTRKVVVVPRASTAGPLYVTVQPANEVTEVIPYKVTVYQGVFNAYVARVPLTQGNKAPLDVLTPSLATLSGITKDYTFELSSVGNERDFFQINSVTGVISLTANVGAAGLDRLATPSFTLEILAKHNTVPCLQGIQSVVITVTDGNSAAPSWTQLTYSASVEEYRNGARRRRAAPVVGAVLFTLSATDPDPSEMGRITYAIVEGNVGNTFSLNAASGAVSIAVPENLNYEVAKTFTLSFSATDQGSFVIQ